MQILALPPRRCLSHYAIPRPSHTSRRRLHEALPRNGTRYKLSSSRRSLQCGRLITGTKPSLYKIASQSSSVCHGPFQILRYSPASKPRFSGHPHHGPFSFTAQLRLPLLHASRPGSPHLLVVVGPLLPGPPAWHAASQRRRSIRTTAVLLGKTAPVAPALPPRYLSFRVVAGR